MYKKIIGLFCVALMATVVGCGSSHPPLTIVTGTVTYDGEPLADAVISIMPESGGGWDATTSASPRPASGKSDAEGKFKLTTTFPDGAIVDGAVEGDYTVLVIKLEEMEIEEGDGNEPPVDGADPSAQMMSMMDDDLNTGTKSLILEKFGLSYVTDKDWSNKCSVGALDTPSILNITLNSNGKGKIE